MTREEAIHFAECLKNNWTINFADMEAFCDMAIEALSAEAVQEWIPVSEKMPEEYDQYLCYCGDGYCYVYWLDNEPWVERALADEEIIAWRPLPEPYKGE